MKRLTQVEWLRARLESGHIETGQSMLAAGVQNYKGRVADLRKRYKEEGKGYDYVKTYMKPVTNKHFNAKTEIALYYIPEKCSKLKLWVNGIK